VEEEVEGHIQLGLDCKTIRCIPDPVQTPAPEQQAPMTEAGFQQPTDRRVPCSRRLGHPDPVRFDPAVQAGRPEFGSSGLELCCSLQLQK